LQHKRERIAKLGIGSRISIWWPKEKEYYSGTVSQILEGIDGDKDATSKPHHISYDDGDEEWLNLLHHKFKRVNVKALRLHVGSYVFVYNESKKRSYRGRVTKIKPERARPHRVKYEDKRKGKEWLNLNVHPYLDVAPPACESVLSGPVKAMTLKKRKVEFQDPQRLPFKPKSL
jgi:hypothetical protein